MDTSLVPTHGRSRRRPDAAGSALSPTASSRLLSAVRFMTPGMSRSISTAVNDLESASHRSRCRPVAGANQRAPRPVGSLQHHSSNDPQPPCPPRRHLITAAAASALAYPVSVRHTLRSRLHPADRWICVSGSPGIAIHTAPASAISDEQSAAALPGESLGFVFRASSGSASRPAPHSELPPGRTTTIGATV